MRAIGWTQARRLALLLAASTLAVLGTPAVALADDKDKNPVAFLVSCATIVPLALVPLGLAFHLLLRAAFPRRMRQIVHATETRRARTLVLGFVNALVLGLVTLGAAHAAPPLATAAFLTLATLSFVGSHGVARALGARALGLPEAESLGAARSELRELAVGWFVLSYVSCFPVVGWALGGWWLVRSLGALMTALLAGEDASS